MAGHSKWANIQHRKGAQDAKRGKLFTKLIRELVVAAKQGGPLPEDNPRLRAAVDKALGEIASFDWLVLTSPNGVAGLLDRMKHSSEFGLEASDVAADPEAVAKAAAAVVAQGKAK